MRSPTADPTKVTAVYHKIDRDHMDQIQDLVRGWNDVQFLGCLAPLRTIAATTAGTWKRPDRLLDPRIRTGYRHERGVTVRGLKMAVLNEVLEDMWVGIAAAFVLVSVLEIGVDC